ncbi:MAG TPA: HepT-like ribonuclease domain-containing protein [Patescibacteria group bacterium]|nr:HepT-like ribonuclease domain-containing protein [Patescibacteria group bacterium]
MPPRDLRAYFFDIAEACRLVLEFTAGQSAERFAADPMLRSAVERQLEIVGEALRQALRHHSELLADRIPEAPRIIAFRNQLAHGYASVSEDIVWAIVERDAPALRRKVIGMLDELDSLPESPSRGPSPTGSLRRWTNEELWQALGRYEQECVDRGMRPKAVHSYWDYARRYLAWRQGDYTPRGAPLRPKRTPPPATIADLIAQAGEYARDLEAAGLHPATIATYHRHAMFFIRWLAGEFKPGRRLTGDD